MRSSVGSSTAIASREARRVRELAASGQDHRVCGALQPDRLVVVERCVRMTCQDLERFVVTPELVQGTREEAGDAFGESGARGGVDVAQDRLGQVGTTGEELDPAGEDVLESTGQAELVR